MTPTEDPGYAVGDENKDKLIKRLNRIEGQVRGVKGMVEDERYCIDVVTQVTAIQAALDKVALALLEDHATHCVVGGADEGSEERTAELMGAVKRLMRHG
jgi:DNA-binding FrmR family transcriptional regulator